MALTAVLLDTTAYSAHLRGHPGIVAAVRRATLVGLSPIVLGELKTGFRRGSRLAQNLSELESFLSSPRVRVVPLTEATADRYAAIMEALLRAGTPVPTNDVWIAASAMEHGWPVLTTDEHYQKIPQVLTELHEVRQR